MSTDWVSIFLGSARPLLKRQHSKTFSGTEFLDLLHRVDSISFYSEVFQVAQIRIPSSDDTGFLETSTFRSDESFPRGARSSMELSDARSSTRFEHNCIPSIEVRPCPDRSDSLDGLQIVGARDSL